jgi:hypothetical protein
VLVPLAIDMNQDWRFGADYFESILLDGTGSSCQFESDVLLLLLVSWSFAVIQWTIRGRIQCSGVPVCTAENGCSHGTVITMDLW